MLLRVLASAMVIYSVVVSSVLGLGYMRAERPLAAPDLAAIVGAASADLSVQLARRDSKGHVEFGLMTCSGGVWTEDRIITAAHCVADLKKGQDIIVEVGGKRYVGHAMTGRGAVDERNDLAIVVVIGAKFQHPIRIAAADPAIGSDVWCIGNPLGLFPGNLTKGVLSSKDRISMVGDNGPKAIPRWQYDCTIDQGNSGGMVLNSAGELVAISVEVFTSKMQVGSSFSFGVPLAEIRNFLASA